MKQQAARLLSIFALALGTQATIAAEIWVELDHSQQQSTTDEITPQPGDTVSIKIVNTCPDAFDYQTTTLTRPKPLPPSGALGKPAECKGAKQTKWLADNGFCVMQEKTLKFTHARKTDLYQVQIRRKDPASKHKALNGVTEEMIGEIREAADCKEPDTWEGRTKTLPDRVYAVSVKRSSWALGMSGGLTVSWVTDPVYAIVDDPASVAIPPETIVVQDASAEDSHALGFAGFVHLHHRDWRLPKTDIGLAPTFGLGIAEQNTLSGFIGVALTAGDIGYLNIGWNWRQVDRLPAGQLLGSSPINDNVLTDLPKRVDDGVFIGFSFRFMSPGESFFSKNVVTETDKSDSE
jgi:hypothetical protein